MDITSFVLGNKIGYKKGYDDGSASGTHPDLRYVTFMNGEEVHYVKPVAVGDDCVDVVAKGLVSSPKKESDVQYKYTYSGWSSTDDNKVDTNLFTAVTEDRTVYACFESSVRSYYVSYYDGDKLLKREALPYGTMPAYTPENQEGKRFDKWSPALTTVTGDTSYYAQWTEVLTFANGTWGEIAEIVEAGEAADYFKLGDEKDVVVGEQTLKAKIIGFGHDDLADGSGKAGITMVLANAPTGEFTTNGGWVKLSSDMESIILPKFPADLQPLIKSVTKQCDTWEQKVVQSPVNVDFKLFPLSLDEMKIGSHGTLRYTDETWRIRFTELGTPYEFYNQNYSQSYYGSFYGAHGAVNPQAWIRQYDRNPYNMTTLRGKPSLLMSMQNLFTYCDAQLATDAYPVQVAFCI